MTRKPGIFPTFFLSGFECSTFDWKHNGRRNLVEETQHDRHLDEDYQLLRHLGIAVSREGIPWPFVDQNGAYDSSRIDPMIAAMNEARVIPNWDLCHYGYPDGLDPFSAEFARRFADYCRACMARISLRPSMKLPTILYRKEHPELGGSPEILDIVGANNYAFGQMEYREEGPHTALDPHDDRIMALGDLMTLVWKRSHRPIIIGETSGLHEGRDE